MLKIYIAQFFIPPALGVNYLMGIVSAIQAWTVQPKDIFKS